MLYRNFYSQRGPVSVEITFPYRERRLRDHNGAGAVLRMSVADWHRLRASFTGFAREDSTVRFRQVRSTRNGNTHRRISLPGAQS